MGSNNAHGHEIGHQKYEKGFEDGYNAAMKYDKNIAALQAKCDRYEKALKDIELLGDGATITHLRTCKKVATEALAGDGGKEEEG
jgi:hypothetical protein